jgi:hypothetical protein
MIEQENSKIEDTKAVEETNPFSKVAEAINQQYNPIGEKKQDMFQSEPFFKEEVKEEKTEEKVEEGKDTIINKEEKKPEVDTEKIVETEIVAEKQITETDILGALNSELGASFNSVEDIKALIEENQKFKKADSEIRELGQEERARLEVGREHGDYGLYDRVMGIDTSKLTHKEAIRQVYFLEKSGKNPVLVEKLFEKEFAKTYEEETDEETSKMLLEDNGQEAIEKIIDLQNDFKKLGQVSGGVDPEKEKQAKIEEDDKWFAAVDSVLGKTDRVTYDLEDGSKINIVMDVNDKPLIQDAMDNPIPFLKSLITDDNGNVDHEAQLEFVLWNFYKEKALDEARKSGAALREEKILKEKKNSVIETGKAGDAVAETPVGEQIAKNFRSLINY